MRQQARHGGMSDAGINALGLFQLPDRQIQPPVSMGAPVDFVLHHVQLGQIGIECPRLVKRFPRAIHPFPSVQGLHKQPHPGIAISQLR